ncbi:GDP/UDP-N,N'-diacetylbacillosamine 2-epimerase (hydrolysing) [Lachnospiraceae bacterium YSD2013]|nr:GDP/UDP-N,N'-diacetylbacillosamine 2-epimerase (hydrolysing) [Lachnospiraceae bacterium YSD2013]
MKKVAIVTTTRAEYGLLYPVISKLREREDKQFLVKLIVSGTHLSENYGLTVKEIENDNVRIDYRIAIPTDSKDACDISNNQAETLKEFTCLFSREQFDAVVILGDRYEMLAVAIAAGNTHTPIFHLCGGDTTEGAIDEWIRHSITKMSYAHFVTNEESRRRVIQMGENPNRVFNYGSPGIDNIRACPLMEKSEALKSVGLKDCHYALCTYHPVTLDKKDVSVLMEDFFKVIKANSDIEFIVTKSNADQGGEYINSLLDEADKETNNLHVFSSLGVKRYLSLMQHAEFVLGNSSSGILEAPSMHIPTINIGSRQRGRLRAKSVIDCGEDSESIEYAIRKARSAEFKQTCLESQSPYGDGHASEKIATEIYKILRHGNIQLCKKFYDL